MQRKEWLAYTFSQFDELCFFFIEIVHGLEEVREIQPDPKTQAVQETQAVQVTQPDLDTQPVQEIQPIPVVQRTAATPNNDRSCFQRCLDKIYPWDKKFLFSTISVSTYLVNMIILFHLTCTFSFLYTTRVMSPISFLTQSLEQVLDIGLFISLHLNDVILFFSRDQR